MLPKWLALGAGLLVVCGVFGWQSWELYTIHQGAFIDENTLKIRAVSRPETGVGLEQVAGMHLFGNPAARPAAEPVPTVLPKTDLKLILVGAITDTDASRASALIEADRQTKRYYVGESIPGGAVLHEVSRDSVVLKRENRYETLSFPKAADVVQARAGTASLGQRSVPRPPPVSSPPPEAFEDPEEESGSPAAARNQGLTLKQRLQRVSRPPRQNPQGGGVESLPDDSE